jgi:uncharacterized membrane protein YtjA (UPF0391 family)
VSYYAAGLFGIAVIAEVLGLGGIPAKALETENVLFIVLLLAFIGLLLRRFGRH